MRLTDQELDRVYHEAALVAPEMTRHEVEVLAGIYSHAWADGGGNRWGVLGTYLANEIDKILATR